MRMRMAGDVVRAAATRPRPPKRSARPRASRPCPRWPPSCGWPPENPSGRRGSSTSSPRPALDGIARDVDFLLTMSCVVGVAAAVGLADVAREGCSRARAVRRPRRDQHRRSDLPRRRRRLPLSCAPRHRRRRRRPVAPLGPERVPANRRRLVGPRTRDRPQPRRIVDRTRPSRFGATTPAAGPSATRTATFALADLKGLHYLRYLVERPGVDVEALALSDAVAGHPGMDLKQADTGDILDATARRGVPPTPRRARRTTRRGRRPRRPTRRTGGRRRARRTARPAPQRNRSRRPRASQRRVNRTGADRRAQGHRRHDHADRATRSRVWLAICATPSTPARRVATTRIPTSPITWLTR